LAKVDALEPQYAAASNVFSILRGMCLRRCMCHLDSSGTCRIVVAILPPYKLALADNIRGNIGGGVMSLLTRPFSVRTSDMILDRFCRGVRGLGIRPVQPLLQISCFLADLWKGLTVTQSTLMLASDYHLG